MKLYDEGKITLTEKLSDFLPYLKGTDKENIRIFDVLGHQAGFKSWIPFYTSTIINGKPDTAIYHKKFSKTFSLKVADSLYINNSYYDTIIKKITDTPLNKSKDYLYSDLGLYFLKEIIEKITGQKIDDYVSKTFYNPIGLYSTVYNPLNYFPRDKITPSEIDSTFRNQKIQGYVNDQGAAMLGGVACHAGIFSNAWDVAVIMQMLLNEGKLDNIQYIKPTTVNLFTKRHFVNNNNNRRALLFDKPLLNPDGTGPTCISASQNSYGHSGFTGTYTWADPDNKLIYVFLSNRTYPKPDNKTISTLNIRTLIHQLAYEAVKNSK
ncbi:MAG: putative periplasmic esterase [Bacteroidetes bacterium ADurb.Bin408]|nr:MAG: putative periplasmic esterase [Bacteroidetes bacterium ADurb.Bin408]